MTVPRWRDFAPGVRLPSTWTDGVESLISSFVSPNFQLLKQSATVVRIPATAGAGAVTLAIGGKPRWIETNLDVTHPGGAAGTYPLFVTGAVDAFSTIAVGQPNAGAEQDDTDHAFYGRITAIGGTPTGAGTQAIWRQVAQVVWDGAAITDVLPTVGSMIGQSSVSLGMLQQAVLDQFIPIGAQMPYTGQGDLASGNFLLADGRLISSATYPAFDATCGQSAPTQHKYNGGANPGAGFVRLPNKQGRGSVGADAMTGTRVVGVAPAAAGLLTTAAGHANTPGGTGGAERHSMSPGEMPSHTHGTEMAPYWDSANGSGGIWEGATNTSPIFPPRSNFAVTNLATGSAGGSGPHNNMHPYEVDNWIVRVK